MSGGPGVAVVAPGFEPVAHLLREAAAADPYQRSQLCVLHRGVTVLDVCAGEGVVPEAVTSVFSASKGLGSLVVAWLVQEGLLDPSRPVAAYWPEFAAAGKADITVNQLLSHQAGLLGVPGGLPMEQLLDPRAAAAALAALEPQWTPGIAPGYHAISFGPLAEELVLRACGRSAQELYEELLRAPIDAQAWLGFPEGMEPRFVPAPQVPEPVVEDPFSLEGLALNSLRGFTDEAGQRVGLLQAVNQRRVRASGSLAVGGVANARGLAAVYAAAVTGIVVPGHNDPRAPLLSEETVRSVARERVYGPDRVSGDLRAFGLGFARPKPGEDFGSAEALGHNGANGTVAFADPAWETAFAYVPFVPQPTGGDSLSQRLTVELRKALVELNAR